MEEIATIKTEETENIFDKGCLVLLNVRVWEAVRKIDPKELNGTVLNGNGGNNKLNSEVMVDLDWLKARKKLIDPESLKPISKVGGAARNWLTGYSLPFPIKGMCFVPKDLITDVDAKLSEFRSIFDGEVLNFVEDYPELKKTARLCLGSLFKEMDYPADIRSRFSLSWQFIVIDLPSAKGGILTPEIYEKAKSDFFSNMAEARELAMTTLRKEFSDMLSRIADRFTANSEGKVKVFKSATVESFYEYFQTFRQRNIFQDKELSALVSKAQEILGGSKAEEFRGNDSLREQTGRRMAEINKQMEKLFDAPRRKIELDLT